MTDDIFKVRTIPTESNPRSRTVFEGSEDDARAFVVNNFPRPHVEPGTVNSDELTYDVALVRPGGRVDNGATYDGKDWSDAEKSAPAASAAKKPAAKKTTTGKGR